jgi:hypothetical protein
MNRVIALGLGLAMMLASGSCGEEDAPTADAGATSYGNATCGNGKVEGDELCDKTDLNKETCKTLGDGLYTGGTLLCSTKCTFNVTMCIGNDSGARDMDSGTGGTGG